MKKTIIVVMLLVTAAFAIDTSVLAQRRTPAPRKAAPSLLASLPRADALALINLRMLLDQAPKMFADDPAKLAQVNADLDRFKTSTGVDPRSIDQIAVGMRYTYPSEGISKIESVALARGTFNTASVIAAGRTAANGNFREEKYAGRSIYVFSLNQQMKVLGVFTMKINDLAVCPLSNNLLALGSLKTVKDAVDAVKTPSSTANQELIALATKDPNAAVGFGGNVTPELLKTISLNEAAAKDLTTIRQVYGTVSVTEGNVELAINARTLTAEDAKSLAGTLDGLKQLGSFVIAGRLSGPKGVVAKTALDNLRITTQGNELQIRVAVPQSQLASLLR